MAEGGLQCGEIRPEELQVAGVNCAALSYVAGCELD